ncbi:TPA: hypothetical protein ACPSKB_000776 [Legionella feeleii]
MPKLSERKAKTLKLIVLRYLQGANLDLTKESLERECLELNYPCQDLFEFIELKDENDPLILAILGSLAVKKNRPNDASKADSKTEGAYEKLFANSKNLYELLTHLYHDGHHHLGYLLKVIDKTKPSYLWTLIAGALSSIGLGSWAYNSGAGHAILIWIERIAPPLIHWLSKSVSILRNMPLLGVIYNTLTLSWIWRSTLAYGTTTNPRKVYYLFFETLAKTLTIIAYLLALMAIAHMTIIPACLFIASSFSDVVKSVCSLFINYQQKKTIDFVIDRSAPWEKQAQQRRSINLIERSSETVWVKLFAAGLTTTTVAFMCLIPPSLFLSASCLTVMALVFLAKHSLLASVHELFAVKLQVSISEIGPPDDPGLCPVIVIEESGPAFENEPDLTQIVLGHVSTVVDSVVTAVTEHSPTTIIRRLGGRGTPEPTPLIDHQHFPPLLEAPSPKTGQGKIKGEEDKANGNTFKLDD